MLLFVVDSVSALVMFAVAALSAACLVSPNRGLICCLVVCSQLLYFAAWYVLLKNPYKDPRGCRPG